MPCPGRKQASNSSQFHSILCKGKTVTSFREFSRLNPTNTPGNNRWMSERARIVHPKLELSEQKVGQTPAVLLCQFELDLRKKGIRFCTTTTTGFPSTNKVMRKGDLVLGRERNHPNWWWFWWCAKIEGRKNDINLINEGFVVVNLIGGRKRIQWSSIPSILFNANGLEHKWLTWTFPLAFSLPQNRILNTNEFDLNDDLLSASFHFTFFFPTSERARTLTACSLRRSSSGSVEV